MPALPSRKKRKLTSTANRGARLTQTDLDEIAAPSNDSSLTNKYNLKYDPGDPNLTEEQRAEWRKEQRKARNRASAAASRLKTKARIDELEGEVSELRRMYAAAVARIAELEGTGGATSFATGIGRVASTTISPPCSPPPSRASMHEESAGFPDMPPLDLHVASTSMVHDSPSTLNSNSYDHPDDSSISNNADADADANAAEKQHITGAASHEPQRQQQSRSQDRQGQDHPQSSSSLSSYEPSLDFHATATAENYGYAGMSAGSTAAIVQALDGQSQSEYASSSPSLQSTSSDESLIPSEEEKDDLEEFLLDAFDGFDATEISAI